MATINFYLDRARSDGRCPVFMVYQSKGKKWKYYTKEKLLPKYWDRKKQRAKQISDAPEINDVLDFYESKAKRIERQFRMMDEPFTIDDIQKSFLGNQGKKIDMFEFFEEQVEQMKLTKSHFTYKKYKSLLNDLRGYEAYYNTKLGFNDIDDEFLNKLIAFLSGRGNAHNTVQKKIVDIKTLFKKATKAGVNKKLDYQDFSLSKIKTEKVHLTKEELINIYKLDLAGNKRLDKVRDIFCFCCFTGLRYSDTQGLRFVSIINRKNTDGKDYKLLNFNVYKTKDILRIPLNKQAIEILDKYREQAVIAIKAINGEVEKELMDRKILPAISNQKMNDYIKEVGELAKIDNSVSVTTFIGTERHDKTYKKYELLSSHAARRTFTTLSLEMNMPIKQVQEILGHKSIRTTMGYASEKEEKKNIEMQKAWDKFNF